MKRQLIKRFIIVALILLVIFGITVTWYFVKVRMIKRYLSGHKAPLVTVSAMITRKKTWYPVLNTVGSIKAVDGVEINSEVAGQVMKIYFKSGQFVQKGDPLVQLNDALDEQTLNNNIAVLRLDTLNYFRQTALYKMKATSKADVDAASAKMLQAKAQVMSARVMIQKKRITAPFSGKLGLRNVNLGEYVASGKPMVLLQSRNPVLLVFALPERFFSKISLGQEVDITLDTHIGLIYKGKITAIDSTVDVNTRTISIQATFSNDKGDLYPGVFADVSVILPKKLSIITVPQTAITYSLYGDLVYVLTKHTDKSGKTILIAKQRFVTVGERRNTVIAITKGLKQGDQIVTTGQLKLHQGSHVLVNNTLILH